MKAIFVLLLSIHATAQVNTDMPLAKAKDKAEAIEQDDSNVLQRHLPFYFAYGRETSKLQLSFKTPLVRTWPLYFGYTQQMFWALHQHSKPFQDLTFNPELFYSIRTEKYRLLKSVDLGIFNHNSNGKAGHDSRSFNKSYVRFNFEKQLRHWVAKFGVQGQYVNNFDSGNRDIQTHVGALSFHLSFIQLFDGYWIDKSEIALQAMPGGKFATGWDYGGYQLSWSFRLGGIRIVPAFYLQYYRGFAETLLNYDKRVSVFRAGVIF